MHRYRPRAPSPPRTPGPRAHSATVPRRRRQAAHPDLAPRDPGRAEGCGPHGARHASRPRERGHPGTPGTARI